MKSPDRIHIRDLRLRGRVGVETEERSRKQELLISITVQTSLHEAAEHDDITLSVDYAELERKVANLVGTSSFALIETLAERIAALVLEHPRVEACGVTVNKPGALERARSAAVEIHRGR